MRKKIYRNELFIIIIISSHRLSGVNWISNSENLNNWYAVAVVNFETRSDTGKANRPVHTTIIPLLR